MATGWLPDEALRVEGRIGVDDRELDEAAAPRRADAALDEARGGGQPVVDARAAAVCLVTLGHDEAGVLRALAHARPGAPPPRAWISSLLAAPPPPSPRERSVRLCLDAAAAAPPVAALTIAVAEGIIRALQRVRDRGQAAALPVIAGAIERWRAARGVALAPSPDSLARACAAPLAIARADPDLVEGVARLLGIEPRAIVAPGEAALPAGWPLLALAPRVQRVARDLHAIAVEGRALPHDVYPPN